MKKNEIKKELYITKPSAVFLEAKNMNIWYHTYIYGESEGKTPEDGLHDIYFKIPFEEAKDMHLEHDMESHLLIRWLTDENN